jgi:hypothetical protein
LCTLAYFDREEPEEERLRQRFAYLWSEAEWE